jgi:hypothetical protein
VDQERYAFFSAVVSEYFYGMTHLLRVCNDLLNESVACLFGGIGRDRDRWLPFQGHDPCAIRTDGYNIVRHASHLPEARN